VIKDEKAMMDFLKFISFNIKSINGDRGSAIPLIEALFNQNAKIKAKGYNYGTVKIKQEVDHKIMTMTYRKYLLLRIKSKISYIAHKKRMTIQ
jgi:hypothetical protein